MIAPLTLRGILCLLVLISTGLQASARQGNPIDITVNCDSLSRTEIHYQFGDFNVHYPVVNGEKHLALSINRESFLMAVNAGHPQLPVVCRSIMIPDSSRMEVRLLESRYHEIYDIPKIIPWRGPIRRSVDPESVAYIQNPEVYGRDEFFPNRIIGLGEPYVLRDRRGIVVQAVPFQYNPVRNVLRIYTEMEVEVVADGAGLINVIDRDRLAYKPDRSFDVIYKKQFLNYSQIINSLSGLPSEDGGLLIISSSFFLSSLQSLADWKNSIGIPTTLVDVAHIGNDPMFIKSYIENMFYSDNLSFVLLVGDYNEVKSPYHKGGVSDPSYAVITGDSYPDIFVGRFSAESIIEVETQVKRTLQYEHEGHHVSMGGWNAAGMGIAGFDCTSHMDQIRDALLAGGFTQVDRIYDPGASKIDLIDGLHEGRRIVNYCGHGSTTLWGTTGLSINDVFHLDNVDKLPFVHSVACYGGDFDKGTCMGEAFLRSVHDGEPAGAVASYNASSIQYWLPPLSAQLTAAEYFLNETLWSVGGCWYGGCCRMIDLYGPTGVDTFMTWSLFGDPSLRLTGVPEDLTLDADSWVVPVDVPVDIQFTIEQDPLYGGYLYCILCGVTGTLPGASLPNGLNIPLNFDAFTAFAVGLLNTPLFQNFYGTLDKSGVASATLSTQGLIPLDPSLVGLKLYFAAVSWPGAGAFEAVTNPKMLTIVK